MLYETGLPMLTLRPSPYDARDYIIERSLKASEYPDEIDLRKWDSPVDDQSTLGSCSSNAAVNAYENMVNHLYPGRFKNLSRLFLYYHSRVLEESVEEDAGVWYLRDTMKALKMYGVCAEDVWPYEKENFNVAPSGGAYLDAATRRIKTYNVLYSMSEMIESLSSGRPIVVGLYIFDDFMTMTAADPVVAIPTSHQFATGGHAMSIVGVSMKRQQFLAKNSFGTSWGLDGYCWIPFEYVRKYVFEKWCFEIENQDTWLLN